jgi:tetratricopeptide (TPR) repeat protein
VAAQDTPESREIAIQYLERALQNGRSLPEDFILLAELYGRGEKRTEAIQVLERGWAANPHFREFSENIAAQKIAMGQYGQALQVIRKGLDCFPDDINLRLLHKKVSSATLPE